ncbi:hypothetical protein MMC07_000259 [Pseudocyphellaria aurata]|nr:hypothetical protein [Pseudocyphellaria aurata]
MGFLRKLCGRANSSDDKPFAHPGRAVGTEAPSSSSGPRAAVPRISGGSGSQGRTLGGSGGGGSGVTDARQAAARAAEERAAKASQQAQKGKLARELAREKAQSMNGALGSASQEERRRREVDDRAETRNYN